MVDKKEELKIVMASAASKALDYIEKHESKAGYEGEKVIKEVMKNVEISPSMKIYAISAANEILKIKKNNPKFNKKQIMQSFMNNLRILIADVELG